MCPSLTAPQGPLRVGTTHPIMALHTLSRWGGGCHILKVSHLLWFQVGLECLSPPHVGHPVRHLHSRLIHMGLSRSRPYLLPELRESCSSGDHTSYNCPMWALQVRTGHSKSAPHRLFQGAPHIPSLPHLGCSRGGVWDTSVYMDSVVMIHGLFYFPGGHSTFLYSLKGTFPRYGLQSFRVSMPFPILVFSTGVYLLESLYFPQHLCHCLLTHEAWHLPQYYWAAHSWLLHCGDTVHVSAHSPTVLSFLYSF